MPIVKAYIDERVAERLLPERLFAACAEIIPAAFHCHAAPLRPGNIRFIPCVVVDGHMADVLLEISAFPAVGRRPHPRVITRVLRAVLGEAFIFDVSISLGMTGWASDKPDLEPDDEPDMRIEAAVARARARLARARLACV